MGWLFSHYWRQFSTALLYFKDFSDLQPKLSHGQHLLSVPGLSFRDGSFISVFIKDNLTRIIFCDSHLPSASFCMTDLLLLWPFLLCILEATSYIYMWMFGVGDWNWPEKKTNGEVICVSLVSVVSVWEGLVCWIPVFTDCFGWFWGWCWRNSFSNFTAALPFLTRLPVTSFTCCLPISKLVW